ncbi:hypothetical protein EDB19DRAFT_1826071 [Suillus lakei]|nr:hypothetical protein EDB19DRAFT_1826071 [Suillus lakei]
MLRIVRHLLHPTNTPSRWEGQSIRLEVISGENLKVPSKRIPAGIYLSLNVDSRRRWKSTVRVLSSDESVVWGETVTLSLFKSPKLSIEIRASFELEPMLGNGEVIGKLQTSWDELLDHGDEPFGHARFAKYVTSKSIFHLNDAAQYFQLVLAQCPADHPDHAAALTNLAWTSLEGYIRKDFQDIDFITSLFREALALRPQGHPDHPSSLYHLLQVLIWRYSKENTAAYIHESAELSCKLLPLCPEGTYFRSIATGANGVDYVIRECNKLPTEASDEGIHLRQNVLKLCPLGNKHRPTALLQLAHVVDRRFKQCGSIDDLDECVQCCREAVSLCSEGYSKRHTYLNNMALSLCYRFDYQGKSNDLDEAISLHEEVLHLQPVGQKYHDLSLDNLGEALHTRFHQRGDIDDLNRAISLRREALTLCPPGNLHHDRMLNNLAIVLKTRYVKLDASEDLNEAINLYRSCLQLRPHGHQLRPGTLRNLSSALCSHFTQTQKNEDVEEAIRLCQESLEALPSLHPDRYFGYMGLQVAYLSHYLVRRKSADLSLAIENFRLASRHPTQGFPRRIKEAINWTFAAERHNHSSALEAYKTFFELLDRHLASLSSIVARREASAAFRRANALPVNAASCAVRLDDLRDAIELVEQGRGQQWSLASRLRSPLEDLQSTNPNLAHTFSDLSNRLSEAQGSETCKLAARQGPVIILTASEYSCGAIVVPTSGELPPHLEKLKDDFATAIRHTARMRPEEPRKKLRVLLRIVWDEIILPIVNVLQHDLKLRRRSRIWLCPTAAFMTVPLHAANPFRMKADCSGPEACLEDIYICSFTPTLSALIRSRQTMKTCVTPSFAVIGQSQPGAGQGAVLPAVDSELELVRELVPSNVKFTNLSGDGATQAGALNALQQNSWVHLACHGKQDHEQPYNSCFAMRDKPLTLLDIMENNSPQC